jgi:hypothetical protein
MLFFFLMVGALGVLTLILILTGNFGGRILAPVCLGMALVGILCLFQPFSMVLFGKGFSILLVGFIGYNVFSHLK